MQHHVRIRYVYFSFEVIVVYFNNLNRKGRNELNRFFFSNYIFWQYAYYVSMMVGFKLRHYTILYRGGPVVAHLHPEQQRDYCFVMGL